MPDSTSPFEGDILIALSLFIIVMALLTTVILLRRKQGRQRPGMPGAEYQVEMHGADQSRTVISVHSQQNKEALPARIGDYRIESRLPDGGFAQVYKARDRQGRQVAIKMLNVQHLSNTEVVRRFSREGEILGRVRTHAVQFTYAPEGMPIPEYRNLGQLGQQPYLVMEFLEGVRLDDLIRHYGRLSDENIRIILRDVCAALEATHMAGLCHLDVKPQNIIVSVREGSGPLQVLRAKLLDFGAAVEYMLPNPFEGGVAFTPPYVSPEHKSKISISPRSDLYSLGMVLYEMATGKILDSHTVPGAIPEMVSPQVRDLLHELLQNNPMQRPPTAVVVGTRLFNPPPYAPLPR